MSLGVMAAGKTAEYLPTVSAAPAAVYGCYKLVSGYAGPLMAVCATTDTATPASPMDVNALPNGAPDLSAAIAAWGTSFDVWKLYDQSGNGLDATQTTVNRRMRIQGTLVAGLVSIMAANANFGYFSIPSGLVTSRQNLSAFVVGSGNNSGTNNAYLPWLSVGATDVSSALSLYTMRQGMSARGNVEAISLMPVLNEPAVFGYQSSSSNFTFHLNEYSKTATAMAAAAGMVGGHVCWRPGSAVSITNEMASFYGAVIYVAALSNADTTLVKNALMSRFGIALRGAQIVVMGDSIQAGLGQGTSSALPMKNKWYDIAGQLPRSPRITNIATGGDSASNATAYFTQAMFNALYKSGMAKNLLVMNFGSNDIFGSLATASATWTTYQTLLGRAKTAGFELVVEQVIPRTGGAGPQAERDSFNALLAANASSIGYTFVDYSGISISTTDGIHPYYVNGYDRMASVLKPILQTLLA